MQEEEGFTLGKLEDLDLRYRLENRIMAAVSAGEEETAIGLAAQFPAIQPDDLQTYNVLLRKAAERGGVLPVALERLSASWRNVKTGRNFPQKAFEQMIRDYCLAVKRCKDTHYSPQVKRAVSYIHGNLSHTLNLRTIARNLNVSPSYLSALFKKETGETLTAYIHRQRITLAMDLLKKTSMQVQAVGQACGYEDIHYFSRLFRRIAGVSPQGFRQKQRS